MRCVVALSLIAAVAASPAQTQVHAFGTTVKLPGNTIAKAEYPDGVSVESVSATTQTLSVWRNQNPLSGRYVTGATGGPWVAVYPYSYIIRPAANSTTTYSSLSLTYTPEVLSNAGLADYELFVGELAADGRSWIVDESARSIIRNNYKARLYRESFSGEFRLLARVTPNNIGPVFLDYGAGPGRTSVFVAYPGGPQTATFADGLKVSVVTAQSASAVRIDGSLLTGVEKAELPAGALSLNQWRWRFATDASTLALSQASIKFPVSASSLRALFPGASNVKTSVAYRKAAGQAWKDVSKLTIVKDASGFFATVDTDVLDGEWVVLVKPASSATGVDLPL